MESTLITVLVTILCVIAIILGIYLIITFRKIHIVAKKIDYLVEDLTYKSEQLTPVIDSASKFSNIIDTIDSVLTEKTQNIIKKTSTKDEPILSIAKEVKKEINKTKSKSK